MLHRAATSSKRLWTLVTAPSVGARTSLNPARQLSRSMTGASAPRDTQLVGSQVFNMSPTSPLLSPDVSVDITRSNFSAMFPIVKQALDECYFFSFDCEMTGLFLGNSSDQFFDTMQDRYTRVRSSAQSFVINQFGLSCFARDAAGNAYAAKTFNFYIFPEPFENFNKRFTSEAASLSFLARQGFDFNKAIYEGVPYLPAPLRDAKLAQLASPPSRDASRAIVPTLPADILFVSDLVTSVTTWLRTSTEPTLSLPPVNRYQRRLQYQSLEQPQFGVEGSTGFFVERVDPPDSGHAFNASLRLRRASDQEIKQQRQEQQQQREEEIHAAAGFTRVLEAMRDSGRPAVGHNMMLDLAYVLGSFAVEELPQEWEGFKALVAGWLPGGVYDTKHLSRQLPDLFSDTMLSLVYRGCTESQAIARRLGARLPGLQHAEGYDKYRGLEAGALAHEAGYDAFMTGASFAVLLELHGAEGSKQPAQGGGAEAVQGMAVEEGGPLQFVGRFNGRVNIARSDLPYIAVVGPDALLDRSHVFHVSGLVGGLPVGGGRWGAVAAAFGEAGLGSVRVNGAGAGAVVVEVGKDVASRVVEVMGARGGGLVVRPWEGYGRVEQGEGGQKNGVSKKRPRAEEGGGASVEGGGDKCVVM